MIVFLLFLAQLPAPTGVALPPAPIIVTPLDPAIYAAAIVTVLTSLGGAVVLIINAFAAAKDRRDARQERRLMLASAAAAVTVSEATGKKADVLIEATGKIHELTNATNSNLQKALDVLHEKVAGQDRLIAQLHQTMRDTASHQATSDLQIAAALQTTPPQPPRPGRATDAPPLPDPLRVEVVNIPKPE